MEYNKFTLGESIRSVIDVGKVAVAEAIRVIDEKFANAVNRPEDES